jgi:hypothetical protein
MTGACTNHFSNTYVLRHEISTHESPCHFQSGGSTPRAGLNPKEKEERRRELDRMREDDRARRAAGAVSSQLRVAFLTHRVLNPGINRNTSSIYALNMTR